MWNKAILSLLSRSVFSSSSDYILDLDLRCHDGFCPLRCWKADFFFFPFYTGWMLVVTCWVGGGILDNWSVHLVYLFLCFFFFVSRKSKFPTKPPAVASYSSVIILDPTDWSSGFDSIAYCNQGLISIMRGASGVLQHCQRWSFLFTVEMNITIVSAMHIAWMETCHKFFSANRFWIRANDLSIWGCLHWRMPMSIF